MAKKKASKHKRKCPRGWKFGRNWYKDEVYCWNNCKWRKECEAKYDRLLSKKSRQEEERQYEEENESGIITKDGLRKAFEDDEDKPKKKQHKKTTKPKKKLDERPIVIAPFEKLLNISYLYCTKLYLIYMRRGIEQKTNQTWCNDTYAAKKMKCSESTVVRAKNLLVKAGLIKIIQARGKRGRFCKSYIKIIDYPSKFVIEKAEYRRRLDVAANDLADMASVFYSEKMKMEIDHVREKKKLKRKYRKLKKNK